MTVPAEQTDALRGWLSLPETIEKAIDGLAESDLDLRGGVDGWSIRETVHHLVEANLIASNILIAALANSGCVYDWSWVNPDKSWMLRLGYDRAPVRPGLTTLSALSEHIAGLIRTNPDALLRKVQLLDAPGAKPHTETVTDLLVEQIEHSAGHLRTVAETRLANRI
jgi:hypothetical protein